MINRDCEDHVNRPKETGSCQVTRNASRFCSPNMDKTIFKNIIPGFMISEPTSASKVMTIK